MGRIVENPQTTSIDSILEKLNVSLENGLASSDITERREEYGLFRHIGYTW